MCCIEDRKSFDRAASEFAAQPGHSNSIATMMRLAVEAEQETLRRWASNWLFKQVNVRVIVEREAGDSYAAPTKAAALC